MTAWSGWSIFQQGGGSGAAATWARDLLQAGGWPETPSNLQALYDWEQAEGGGGTYNPLNTSAGGGNYTSIAAGIQNTLNTLRDPAYSGIVAQLKRGNDYEATVQAIWASPWDSGHYGDGANWPTTAYPSQRSQISGVPGSLASINFPGGLGQGSDIPINPKEGESLLGPIAGPLEEISSVMETAVMGIPNFLHRLGLVLAGFFCISVGVVIIVADVLKPAVRAVIGRTPAGATARAIRAVAS